MNALGNGFLWGSAVIALAVGFWLSRIYFGEPDSHGDSGDPRVRKARRAGRSAQECHAEYSEAVGMMTYESNHFWTTFNSFVVALTVLAALIASTLAVPQLFPATLATGLLGVILCAFWFVALQRTRAYVGLRIAQANELEEELGYSLFRAGHVFAEGGTVEFDSPPQKLSMPTPARRVGLRDLAVAVPGLYVALFLFLLGTSVLSQPKADTVNRPPTVRPQ